MIPYSVTLMLFVVNSLASEDVMFNCSYLLHRKVRILSKVLRMSFHFNSCSPYNGDKYELKTGSLMRSGRGAGSNTQTASKLVTHPQYAHATLEYDIGLVKLSTPLIYSDYIRPACLHDPDKDLSQFVECYTTGWGTNKHSEFRLHIIAIS